MIRRDPADQKKRTLIRREEKFLHTYLCVVTVWTLVTWLAYFIHSKKDRGKSLVRFILSI